MRLLVRLLKTLLVVFVVTSIVASAASALVTVSATSTADPLALSIGDTFDVDIFVSWDGAGELVGIFSSHVWDNTQLDLLGAVYPVNPSFETNPLPLKGGSYDPQLVRLGTIAAGILGDDLSSTARTVSYGVSTEDPLNGATSAKTNELITRLTFQLIGVGDGTIDVDGAILNGDTGALGDDFAFSNLVFIPEPGTAVLMGLGLLGLGAVRKRT